MLVLTVLILSIIEEFVWGDSPELTWYSIWTYGLVVSCVVTVFNSKIGNISILVFLILFGSFIFNSDYHYYQYRFSETKHHAFIILINALYFFSFFLAVRKLRNKNEIKLLYKITGKELKSSTFSILNIVAIALTIVIIIFLN